MVLHRAVGWGPADPGSGKSSLPSGILHCSSGFTRQLVSLLWNQGYLLSKGSTITSHWRSQQTSAANDPLKQVRGAGGNAGGAIYGMDSNQNGCSASMPPHVRGHLQNADVEKAPQNCRWEDGRRGCPPWEQAASIPGHRVGDLSSLALPFLVGERLSHGGQLGWGCKRPGPGLEREVPSAHCGALIAASGISVSPNGPFPSILSFN